MTVRLRAHHLLCLLTYVGRGYSTTFVENLDGIASRLRDGEELVLILGPDDVCAPLLLDDAIAHCFGASAAERDNRAAADVAGLLSRSLVNGSRLVLDTMTLLRLREAFAKRSTRAACGGCEWTDLCTAVAASGFADARLAPD